jgi:hypothetical protein
MLLMFIAGCIFLLLAMSIGYVVNKKLRGASGYSVPLFEILLTGTATLTIYFNILSFLFPADFFLLIPPFIFSIIILFQSNFLKEIKEKWKQLSLVMFCKTNTIITIVVAVIILLFTIVPPYNTDSYTYTIQ